MKNRFKVGSLFLIGLSWVAAIAGRKAFAQVAKEPDYSKSKELAIKYSKVFNVPYPAVMTILSIESGFNTKAVNKSVRAMKRGGAWGVGQMTLDTAKDLTKRYPDIAAKYWPRFKGNGEDLFDLDTNIALMSFYLSLAWRRYKHDLTATLLSYHQGMGTIDELIKDERPWIEKLPPKGSEYLAMIEKESSRFEAYA